MANITHRELAARLVIDAALRGMDGTVSGQLPVSPTVLTDESARVLGMPTGTTALHYQIGERGVFFDIAGSRIAVWYSGADADRAPAHLDAELKRAYPQAQQVKDEPHPEESSQRVRRYDVKLGQGRMANVEVSYSKPGERTPKFGVQIVALAIKN
ncbi:MAG: hypothetical protein IT518_02605 [Burkholderiales bacterium]|nr:hypothetical protein [Burkholderiales bacterium]